MGHKKLKNLKIKKTPDFKYFLENRSLKSMVLGTKQIIKINGFGDKTPKIKKPQNH